MSVLNFTKRPKIFRLLVLAVVTNDNSLLNTIASGVSDLSSIALSAIVDSQAEKMTKNALQKLHLHSKGV
ncbi:hypothetical protein CHS0354_002780 [Potamilus streckersoni]|uniref:Uncharacterized protein n=1 Tax=Potamilus streckersoni TaxID=2493646 RepID=A0AAE0SNI2_9BIVA|nr:hypothetical protein CHS0354_002780 [Potamilus streckersoni]